MKNLNTKKAFHFSHSFAFTLQETLITLTILGVVAAITIPALINKYIESTNRIKVRKAMATYEKALGQMAVENGNSAISSWADGIANNCANTTIFFKKIQGEGCRFQTADKVWWDISNIEHPVIAFSEEDLDDTNAENRFELFAHNEDGILRINDKADELLTADDKTALEKLYAFVNKEKLKVNESVSPFDICTTNGEETCIVNNVTYKAKTITDRQCVDINFGALSGTQSCVGETGKSINVWMTDQLDPSIYGGTSVSDCTITDTDTCRESGADYWGAAINYCKNGGGHLASLGELKAGGYNGAIAAEENDPWSAYYIIDGEAFENYKYLENSIVCIEGSL